MKKFISSINSRSGLASYAIAGINQTLLQLYKLKSYAKKLFKLSTRSYRALAECTTANLRSSSSRTRRIGVSSYIDASKLNSPEGLLFRPRLSMSKTLESSRPQPFFFAVHCAWRRLGVVNPGRNVRPRRQTDVHCTLAPIE